MARLWLKFAQTRLNCTGPSQTALVVVFSVAIAASVPLTLLKTLRPIQNGRLFADDNFKCIFLNANVRISIKISLKFVTGGPTDHIPTLVQIMAWRWPGDKPLSEPMMVRLPTHSCVTRPQWVKAVCHLLGTSWTKCDLSSISLIQSHIYATFFKHFNFRKQKRKFFQKDLRRYHVKASNVNGRTMRADCI